MRTKAFGFLVMIAASAIFVGCAGPEQKFGRGVNNMAEFVRLGEIRRSIEQTAVFGSPDQSLTTGFIHGFNRSMARTGVGIYEVLTFPVPNFSPNDYGPIFHPTDPTYPDSYKPNWIADQMLSPDDNLGFGGGDIAPFIPGSRFHIFDN
jgi:putative exosortase-associated protein (TIGR04073 family)